MGLVPCGHGVVGPGVGPAVDGRALGWFVGPAVGGSVDDTVTAAVARGAEPSTHSSAAS